MGVISETNKKTYNQSRNLLQSFHNSKGNTYISFLLLIIKLYFACGEIIVVKYGI